MTIWGFVIPIVCYFWPYQIMSDIWVRTQHHIKNLKPNFLKSNDGYLIGIWWALFVISALIGKVILKTVFKDETIDELITSLNKNTGSNNSTDLLVNKVMNQTHSSDNISQPVIDKTQKINKPYQTVNMSIDDTLKILKRNYSQYANSSLMNNHKDTGDVKIMKKRPPCSKTASFLCYGAFARQFPHCLFIFLNFFPKMDLSYSVYIQSTVR